MTRFEKWAVWSTTSLTFVTGAVYGWMKYLLEPSDPFAVVNHPLQPWVLKLHILIAPLLVFSLGVIALRHVWWHLTSRLREGRRTGVVLALVACPMVVTGYLIQAVTGVGWLRAVIIVHLAAGAVFTAALVGHQVVVRVRRNGRQEPASAPKAP